MKRRMTGKLEIEGKEYQFPKNWKEMTLGHYIKIQGAISKFKEGEAKMWVKIANLMTGIPEAYFWDSGADLMEMVKSELQYITQPPKKNESPDFTFEGVKYNFPRTFDDDSTKYIGLSDLEQAIKTAQKNGNMWEAEPYIAAIFWRKAGEVYDLEFSENVRDERVEHFKKLPMDKWWPRHAFFLTNMKNSEKGLKQFMEAMKEAQMKLLKDKKD